MKLGATGTGLKMWKRGITAGLMIFLLTGQSVQADTWSDAVSAVSVPGYVWTTASSINARKQFWGDTVLNYAGGEEDPWTYTLVSATKLTGISDDYGNGVQYVYHINTGNEYYMYSNDDTLLECHWQPDGYSASDSLIRTSDNVAENTELIRMEEYDGREITFDISSFSVFTGYYEDDMSEKCLAANLKNPVQIRTGDGDVIVHSIQVFGDAVDAFCAAQNLDLDFSEYDGYKVDNSPATVSGVLMEADTNHHYTPVLMQVTALDGTTSAESGAEYAEGGAYETAEGASALAGSWEDSWSQRAHMQISPSGSEYYCEIRWGSSWNETEAWRFHIQDDGSGEYRFDDCMRVTLLAKDDGSEEEIIKYRFGTGKLILENGNLRWVDDHDHAGDECVFEKM